MISLETSKQQMDPRPIAWEVVQPEQLVVEIEMVEELSTGEQGERN